MPNLSFIIPVYNAEKYIPTCIKSILNQSYHDFELILIDDGSQDKSGEICDEFAINDNRIIVCHTENGGASKARNLGLDLARGEYIWFVDADDWIDDDFLSSLTWDNMPDITFFGFKRKFESHDEICEIQSFDEEFNTNLNNVLNSLFISDNKYFGFTWNKIFKRSIITQSNLNFRTTLIIKEDEVFTLEYCKYISSLKILSAVPYNYRVLPESVSHNSNHPQHMYELASVLDSEVIGKWDSSSLRKTLNNAIFRYYFEAIRENRNDISLDERINRYLDFYRMNQNDINLSFKNKILFLLPTNYLKHKLIKTYLYLI